ncbi:uncharacterized protein LOC128864372 [Anastrepha ludens]|uniref:uncharacterized protein LOC128864372 n=1 Tax=Anastrepha ludens TaxID=28586 RepID=UPI0023AFBEC7|nr:uncharacterized protein LOC128864372 [Anastrepha ludens]
MIIVLLLLFQSLCLYCQRLVLRIHDRWINPKNSRLLKEADETSSAATRKLLLQQYHTGGLEPSKQTRKRTTTSACDEPYGACGILAEACRFCANSPQGYCRHHFHLQELELQKAQKAQHPQDGHPLQSQYRPRFWQPLCGGSSSTALDHTWAQRRHQRKVNRELKRNLKNRLCATTLQQQQQQQHPMQKQYQLQRQYLRRQQYEEFMRSGNAGNNSSSSSSSGSPLWDTSTSNSSSGCQSPFAAVYNVNGSLYDISTTDSGLATSIESIAYNGAEVQETVEQLSPVGGVELAPASTITTTYL